MKKRGFSLIELLMVIAIIAILLSLLAPGLARGKAKAQKISCMGNLRQLGVAVRMYSMDYNQRLPIAEAVPSYPINSNTPLASISAILKPYSVAGVLKCPQDNVGRFAREGSSYEWNANMNNRPIDTTTELGRERVKLILDAPGGNPVRIDTEFPIALNPSVIPLMWDYENFHAPSKAPKNLLFADGHVAPLPQATGDSGWN